MGKLLLETLVNLTVIVGLTLIASSVAFAQQIEFSNDNPEEQNVSKKP